MSRDLPEILELAPYRGRSTSIEGYLSTAGMERLREVGAVAETAEVALTLTDDVHGEMELSGQVQSLIELTCQRCLEPVEVPLVSDFEFVVMDAADARNGEEKSAEVLVVNDAMLRLGQVVEDELLLSLPVVARHDDSAPCRPASRHFGPPGEAAPERDNPFSVLGRLKGDDSD